MTTKIRVAFTLFGDGNWTGGINYLRNLFTAINSTPGNRVEPVLFVSPDTDQDIINFLQLYLNEPPIVVDGWKNTKKNKFRQLFEKGLLQCDKQSLMAFQLANIDAVFQNDRWYGFRFPLPTLAWIADFQHRHLSDMFTYYRRKKRDLAYAMLCKSSTQVMVSSNDAAKDCEMFFSVPTEKISVVPFAVQLDESVLSVEPSEVIQTYNLPDRYFYFPGQLWQHKNHLALLEALSLLKEQGDNVVVVASGNPKDGRSEKYPARVLEFISEKELSENFIFLGMLPYQHIMPLMRGSVAVINPSLFEGWSTIVEEAKALGVPMLLSDLAVHSEQAPKVCRFFDPLKPQEIADVMKESWQEWEAGPRYEIERSAFVEYNQKRLVFAQEFEAVVDEIVKKNV